MKLKFLLIIFTVSFFVFVANKSYAQEYKSIPFFDMSIPISTTHFTKEQLTNEGNTIHPSPITYITIKKGTFTQDVNVLVYKGKWDILTQGPNKEYSPIAAYYIAFLDYQNKELSPSKIIEVLVYNNYGGTQATFTPLSRGKGTPDSIGILVFKNQTNVKALLPQNDAGFIVTINKALDKNDPSLNPTITDSHPSVILSPGPKPSTAGSFIKQNIYLILALVIIVIAILAITFLLLKGSRKQKT